MCDTVMSWKEVLKPSLSEFGPVDNQPPSRLSGCSDGQESMVQTTVDSLYEPGDKLCCGLELPCLPGPSGSGSTYELVCVDEWLKTRTESLSSMDMEVAMKNEGIDPNYLSDSGVSKENPNLSELDQFLTPKGAVDLCIVNDVCGVGSSRKRLSDLGESEDSGLLLSDDLLLKEGPAGKKALFMIESIDETVSKDLKDDDGLCRRGSWADSLELGKDKVNWESMSNTSHRSHELEKDVDFPEFNFVPSFDPLCSIECSLPVGKELESLDKDEENDLSVIPIASKASVEDDSMLEKGDPVLPSIHDSLDAIEEVPVHPKTPPPSISLLKNPLPGKLNVIEEGDDDEDDSSVAVIAISTNKMENTTQIVIRTSQGDQQVFQGKTSELVQATSNLGNQQKLAVPQSTTQTVENGNESESDSDGNSEDQLAMDFGSKQDSSGEGNDEDEQPLIDALADIGIKVDSLVCIATMSGQKMWVCPEKECGKTYPRQSMLKVHILGHYGLRPYKCTFEGCGRRFTTIYNLNTHSKLHERPAEMVCRVPGCNASFQTKRRLENHLKEHDVVHAPYRCPYCGKAYYSSNSLNAHVRSHEHKEEEVRCQWAGCGKLFDKPCRLRAHMRVHTGDRPYSCNFEGCTWSFSSASKLRRHQQKHTDERKFKCNVAGCPKAFLRSEHLREHLSTHAGSRNFQCTVEGCGVKFTAKSSLYVHMKKHQMPQQEKVLYACPVEQCDRKYLCRSSLRHHLLKAHPVTIGSDGNAESLVTFVTSEDDQDILLDGSALVSADGGVVLEPEQNVVLSTINPADIMLTGLSATSSTSCPPILLANGILSVHGDEEEESGTGCARTNLPLPLVPRRRSMLPPATLLSDDLFSDPLLATAHSSGIEFQIMLDSRQSRDFPESTINLRDLE
ncbi:hypothetical protein B566_EDAN011389 [Ephemera danica]|nr:hypothetical protein B566_EDAN011389 [Ephemera danica]